MYIHSHFIESNNGVEQRTEHVGSTLYDVLFNPNIDILITISANRNLTVINDERWNMINRNITNVKNYSGTSSLLRLLLALFLRLLLRRLGLDRWFAGMLDFDYPFVFQFRLVLPRRGDGEDAIGRQLRRHLGDVALFGYQILPDELTRDPAMFVAFLFMVCSNDDEVVNNFNVDLVWLELLDVEDNLELVLVSLDGRGSSVVGTKPISPRSVVRR